MSSSYSSGSLEQDPHSCHKRLPARAHNLLRLSCLDRSLSCPDVRAWESSSADRADEKYWNEDPVIQVIQEMEKFRLEIHCLVHTFSILNDKIASIKRRLKCEQTLIASGFSPIFSVDYRHCLSLDIRVREEAWRRLAGQLEDYRRLGLGDYLDLEKKAMDVELTIISEGLSDEDFYFDLSCAWGPTVLDLLVKYLRLFEKREKIYPAWESLESKRVAGSPKKTDALVLSIMNVLSSRIQFHYVLAFPTNINFKKFNHVCDKYSFHCRYLDDELRNMYTFITERTSINPEVPENVVEHFDLVDDVQLCENLNKRRWDECHHLETDLCGSNERNSFRLYRACLNRGLNQLADEWMQVALDITSTEETITGNLVGRTLLGLWRSERDSRKPRPRQELNGQHIGISRNYRPPIQRQNRATTPSPKPWWTHTENAACTGGQNENCGNLRDTSDSQATTVPPPETLTRSDEERSDDLRRENLELNLAAAAFYRDHNWVSSVDMSRELPLCSVQIEMDQTECLYLKWKNSDGEDQERRTNMQIGKPYHCRTFSYDAVNDEWVGNDTFCKFNSQFDVKQEGGSRVPILGDGGGIYPTKLVKPQPQFQMYRNTGDHEPLFKMYKDKGDHGLDKYLADVRAQSVAAYYADRFRELTDGKFGCLAVLEVQLVLIYDSCERGMIIDIATREKLVAAHRFGIVSLFDKFTNNWSWKHSGMKVDIFEAFSHFTYDDSAGVIMVADLQGFAGIPKGGTIIYGLTDPVIHSLAQGTQTFGRLNHGTEGMNEFFASVHKECNHICEFLKLKRPHESGSQASAQFP